MRRMRPVVAVAVAVAAVLAAAAAPSAAAQIKKPPRGAYTEPAPEPPPEEHAAAVVEDVLQRSGTPAKISPPDLRGGIVVTPAPPSRSPAKKPKVVTTPAVTPLSATGLGPWERAGFEDRSEQGRAARLLLVAGAALLAAAAGAIAVRRG